MKIEDYQGPFPPLMQRLWLRVWSSLYYSNYDSYKLPHRLNRSIARLLEDKTYQELAAQHVIFFQPLIYKPDAPFIALHRALKTALSVLEVPCQELFSWGFLPYLAVPVADFTAIVEKKPDFEEKLFELCQEDLVKQIIVCKENPLPSLSISSALSEEWYQAEAYFKGNPDSLKLQKNNIALNNNFSYLKFGNHILRITPEILGYGGFSTVKKAADSHGHYYALKIEEARVDSVTSAGHELMKHLGIFYGHLTRSSQKRSELVTWSHSENKAKSKYVYNKMYTLMALEEGKNLRIELKKNIFSDSQKLLIALSIFVETYKLHLQGVLHGDLKEDNFLITSDQQKCKPIDFGHSLRIPPHQAMMAMPGELSALDYRAPEVKVAFNDYQYGYPCEVYSLGVILEKFNIKKSEIDDLIKKMKLSYLERIRLDNAIEKLIAIIENGPQDQQTKNYLAEAKRVLIQPPFELPVHPNLQDIVKKGYSPYISYHYQKREHDHQASAKIIRQFLTEFSNSLSQPQKAPTLNIIKKYQREEFAKSTMAKYLTKNANFLFYHSLMFMPDTNFIAMHHALKDALNASSFQYKEQYYLGLFPFLTFVPTILSNGLYQYPDFRMVYNNWQQAFPARLAEINRSFFPSLTTTSVPDQGWVRADSYFKENPTIVKLRRKEFKQCFSYLKFNDRILQITHEVLGRGLHSTVRKAIESSGRVYALKIEGGALNHYDLAHYDIMKQIGVLYGVLQRELPGVQKLTVYDIGTNSFVDKRVSFKKYSVLEYVEGIDLHQHSLKKTGFTYIELLIIGLMICTETYKLHLQGVLHADPKPDNIRVNKTSEKITVKLVDFSLSIRIPTDNQFTSTAGAVTCTNFRAPEVNGKEPLYGYPSEVYTLSFIMEILKLGDSNKKLIEAMRLDYPDRMALDEVIEKIIEIIEQRSQKEKEQAQSYIEEAKQTLLMPPTDGASSETIKPQGYTPYASYCRQKACYENQALTKMADLRVEKNDIRLN